MKFKGDIIITDPCYIIKKDSEDWRKCDYGDNMAALGLTNYISESTRYGDWSCSTWSTPRKDVEAQLEELNALGRARWELMKQYGEDSVQAKIYDDKIADASLNIEKIGYFCADAGMVAVFLLDEVLKYNPDFDYHINREWTTTLIKDFDGEINRDQLADGAIRGMVATAGDRYTVFMDKKDYLETIRLRRPAAVVRTSG